MLQKQPLKPYYDPSAVQCSGRYSKSVAGSFGMDWPKLALAKNLEPILCSLAQDHHMDPVQLNHFYPSLAKQLIKDKIEGNFKID